MPRWPDVRDATTPGPNAPQRIHTVPGLDVAPLIGGGWIAGDDYPTLNIWARTVMRAACASRWPG